ncbi:Transketolase central region [Methanolacinia petrolearia DSM 11571]|uniref:Transketolase central region n=1 Tax=Methanolacinia petrolearia (strain DSM 11571 / OCM 486 / SEBR 4847) TaxID=679926 RepID=E1REX2_METP4|nr:transketolase family protein [Methanolacinia petrolearia]ADN36143.1 Transketolase central region [Methanolacinia petrolearia DSM 11571]
MSYLSTREACGNALTELGETEKDIFVLDADLSVSTQTKKFAERYPQRFLNVGCAEQNLVGTAAGLAIARKTVFVGSYAMFINRAWEQIRNTISHDNLNVKILASHSGMTNAPDGASHQCFEDIAIMRVIPNMSVLCPADEIEAKKLILAEAYRKGPSYIRLNRIATQPIYDIDYEFEFGKAVQIKEGTDVTVIATGTMVTEAIKASEVLKKEGINAQILNVHTLKPLDNDTIIKAAKDTGRVVTIEEHSRYGGLGGAIAEILAESYPVPMRIIGIKDRFGESGVYEHLINKFGLNASEIVKSAKILLGEKK